MVAPQDWRVLAERLVRALKPFAPPLAVAFCAEVPVAVPPFSGDYPAARNGRTGAVPASCVFWIKGLEGPFITRAADHGNCSIGAYTHGFSSFEEMAAGDDTAAVLESGWVSEGDARALPQVKKSPEAIYYAPLVDADYVDLVFLRISGLALMILKDALPDLLIEGKPQCHILALALERGVPAVSTGCALSRARTGMKAEEISCVLPAARLSELVDKIEQTAALDRTMARYASEDAKRWQSQ